MKNKLPFELIKDHGTIVDGIAASQAIDTSGEELIIEGCDISDLKKGVGVLNWEHRNEKSPGASPEDVVGAVRYASKILKEEDCKLDRELYFWRRLRLPFVYHISELFDAEGDPPAVSLAAKFRYYHKRKIPIVTRYSIDGGTLLKKDNKLVRTIARKIAVTIKPCNRSCESGVLELPKFERKKSLHPERVVLGAHNETESVILEESSVTPDEFESVPEDSKSETSDGLSEISKSEGPEIELAKTLAVGGSQGVTSPAHLTGMAALSREVLRKSGPQKVVDDLTTVKNRLIKVVLSWDGRGALKDFLKKEMEDVSPEYLDYFSGLADEIHLKGDLLRKRIKF